MIDLPEKWQKASTKSSFATARRRGETANAVVLKPLCCSYKVVTIGSATIQSLGSCPCLTNTTKRRQYIWPLTLIIGGSPIREGLNLHAQFDWDAANIEHLATHKVSPEEAEQVIENNPLDLDTVSL